VSGLGKGFLANVFMDFTFRGIELKSGSLMKTVWQAESSREVLRQTVTIYTKKYILLA
jgi:hypothetical protein